MPSDDTPTAPACPPRKAPSGAELARRRAAKGLPRYTPAAIATRARAEAKRVKTRGKKRYAVRLALVSAIKLEQGCRDCGYRAHPAALHFDHLPGSEKVEDIAKLTYMATLAVLMAEIAKCEVVCANCHAIRTVERRVKQAPPEH